METGNTTYDALIAVYFSAPFILAVFVVLALFVTAVALVVKRHDIKRRKTYTESVMEALGFDIQQ